MKKTRRFITGINAQQTSILLQSDSVETFVPYPMFPSFQLQNLFYTEDNPQSLQVHHLETPYDINLPEGAMRFLKIRMPTKKEMVRELKQAGQPIPEDWATHFNHSTDSVDYLYILSGEITCILGEERIELKAGDFLTQIGAEHAWLNEHDEPCYVLCIMVGIKPDPTRKKMSVE